MPETSLQLDSQGSCGSNSAPETSLQLDSQKSCDSNAAPETSLQLDSQGSCDSHWNFQGSDADHQITGAERQLRPDSRFHTRPGERGRHDIHFRRTQLPAGCENRHPACRPIDIWSPARGIRDQSPTTYGERNLNFQLFASRAGSHAVTAWAIALAIPVE